MPSAKPVIVIAALAGVSIWVLFPDYLSLQSAGLPDEFLGVLGDRTAGATAAAVMDLVFAASYGLLGVVLYSIVTAGVPRLIGTVASIGAAVADEVENVMVLLNIQHRSTLTQSAIDTMTTAGAVKWGLVVTAVVLLLALAGQQWLERRRV